MVDKNHKIAFITGLEIELEYNAEVLNLRGHSYHGSSPERLGRHFWREYDSSLSSLKFEEGDTAEIISLPFWNYNWRKVLTDFQKSIYSMIRKRTGLKLSTVKRKYPLDRIINFNNTTGAHVHLTPVILDPKSNKTNVIMCRDAQFSYKGGVFRLGDALCINIVRKFREALKQNVEKQLPSIYPIWKRRVIRGFADKMTRNDFYDTVRNKEFNIHKYKDGRVEYRSFHLFGVENWRDFFKMYKIFFDTVDQILLAEIMKERGFLETRSKKIEKSMVEHREDSKHYGFEQADKLTKLNEWYSINTPLNFEEMIYDGLGMLEPFIKPTHRITLSKLRNVKKLKTDTETQTQLRELEELQTGV